MTAHHISVGMGEAMKSVKKDSVPRALTNVLVISYVSDQVIGLLSPFDDFPCLQKLDVFTMGSRLTMIHSRLRFPCTVDTILTAYANPAHFSVLSCKKP